MAKTISGEQYNKLVDAYLVRGGEIITLLDGVLIPDLQIMYGENLKTSIIGSKFLNEWSSAYTIRQYNKMPKKYGKLLTRVLNGEELKYKDIKLKN